MSDTKNDAKSVTLGMKLSLNKETLRIIDDSELDALDAVVGGVGHAPEEPGKRMCLNTCYITGARRDGEDDGVS